MDYSGFQANRFLPLGAAYFAAPMGRYYSAFTNRLFMYLLLTALLFIECVAAWMFSKGAMALVEKMAFITIYSLHSALAYSLSLWLTDALASRVWAPWAGYANRSVGRIWLVWSGGFLFGFFMQRTLVPCLMVWYARDIVEYYMASPHLRPSHALFLAVSLGLWSVAAATVIQVARRHQHSIEDHLKKAEQGLEGRNHPPAPGRAGQAEETSAAQAAQANGHALHLNVDSRKVEIPFGRITHVTVEDHYCRIFYVNGERLGEVLVRSPLKKIVEDLPQKDFLQIHRSHLVNLAYVSGLSKNGRDLRIKLRGNGGGLPVSRYRLPQVRPRLAHLEDPSVN